MARFSLIALLLVIALLVNPIPNLEARKLLYEDLACNEGSVRGSKATTHFKALLQAFGSPRVGSGIRNIRVLGSVPSPGAGHYYVRPTSTNSRVLESVPSPGAGHYHVWPTSTNSRVLKSVPSPGAGHYYVWPTSTNNRVLESVPSPGAGN